MTPKEKVLYLAIIPLFAAGMGVLATIATTQDSRPQVVLTKEALAAAKGGTVRIELVVKNENTSDLLKPLAPLAMLGGLALMYAAMGRWRD